MKLFYGIKYHHYCMSNIKNSDNPFSTQQNNNFSQEELEIIANNNPNLHNHEEASQGQILNQIDAVFENTKDKSRSQLTLQLKVDQLEKICQQLYKDNKRLSNIIQQFLNQYETNNSKSFSADQFSEINSQVIEIQKLIHEYRQGLESYQQKIAKQLKQKDLQIKQCAIQLQNRKLQNQQLMNEHRNAQQVIRGLKNDFDSFKKQVKATDNQGKKQTKSKNEIKYQSLNSEQEQFVDMVEQFWSEVEKQASTKKQIMQEMEKLKLEVTQLNKELNSKNQQIEELELQLNKYERQTGLSYLKQSGRRTHRRQKTGSEKMKCYSLSDLISKKLNLTNDQIFQIIQKCLDLYEKKFEKQQYSELFPQNMLIFDYHSETMRIFSVRQSNKEIKIKEKNNKVKLISNMTTIILTLLNLCESSGTFFSEQQRTKQKLRQIINITMKSINNGQSIDQFELLAHLITFINDYNQKLVKTESGIKL